ncbi:MAG: monovalent cation/H+ antiporter subunit D family protein [Gammaproteobacteria bacterium]|nr:monovalent cation/H+ antiporter subunit D family protein [Gammaproteobacteria bacterium]
MNPLWTLLPPLLVIPFILFFGEKYRNAREGAIIIAGLVLLFLNNQLYTAVINGEESISGTIAMFPSVGLRLSAEPLGVMFGLLASFLWVVTTVYSIGYMRGHEEKNQTRFYVCFAIALAAVMAAAYADNFLTLFVAYEVLTLSTFPLVTHAGTDKARKAGRVYLGLLIGGSIGLLMPAMIWIWATRGTLDFTPGGVLGETSQWEVLVLLALCLFGIGKAAVMPFHRWLPAAMVAPTPVSALLHAVAVVKTGVFSLLKIVVYIFGIDTLSVSGAGLWLAIFPAFTIVVASIIAFSKTNLKARLAYSTISQLSYIVLAALLASSISIAGGGLHIVTHAFSKITLFFCAGAIMVAAHKTDITEMDGLGRRMPITLLAFLIGSLGIIGVPPVAGMWSKIMIGQGTLVAGEVWLLGVLMLSTVMNVAYLLPIPVRAFFRPPPPEPPGHHDHAEHHESGQGEAPFSCLWAIVLTASASLLLFFYPQPLILLLENIRWRM